MAMTKQSMAQKIMVEMDKITITPDASPAYRAATFEAMCEGILNEFRQNSELNAKTQDSGSAGAGIITGSVK
jgi:hypothetical protein